MGRQIEQLARFAWSLFAGVIRFGPMSPWLLTRVANPVFALYWRIVRRLICG